MPGPTSAPRPATDAAIDAAWTIVLATSKRSRICGRTAGVTRTFAISQDGVLFPVDETIRSCGRRLAAGVRMGCRCCRSTDPRRALHRSLPADLQRHVGRGRSPSAISGQSLDGFIATHSGESQFVTGEENILHLHRMRALCDAVVVGAGTVAADDPQLTTRQVPGPNPLRVVLDPRAGSPSTTRSSPTTRRRRCTSARSAVRRARRERTSASADPCRGTIQPNGMDAAAVLRLLRERGCHRIFVEGGGVTVSMFLQANLLDRLHMAIAPLIIGNGRPAIRLPARDALSECRRPRYRVFRMGGDVFFDCDLSNMGQGPEAGADTLPVVTRII